MEPLKLGAPSLTGKDANDLVAVAFKDAAFLLKLKFTNLAAHSVSFPEVSGLHLKPFTHGDESVAVVTLQNYDALQRLTSSIEQIAELNHNEEMLEISTVEDEAVVVDDIAIVEEEAKAEPEAEVIVEKPAHVKKTKG